MAFSDTEIVRFHELIERLIWAKRRPPLRLRDKRNVPKRTGVGFDMNSAVVAEPGNHSIPCVFALLILR